jgi:TolB protein
LITATPTPTFVVITNTPTPANAAAAVAQAADQATRVAIEGPPTALPPWVVTATPRIVVIGPTAVPDNAATAEYLRVYPTIAALTIGTLTPTPPNLATATFTPVPTPLPLLVPVTLLSPTPTATARPGNIPDSLRGKILFRSDRLGDPEIFVMDPGCVTSPQGCGAAVQFWLTQDYPHRLAWEEESYSPGGQARVVVQPDTNQILQVFYEDTNSGQLAGLTAFEQGSSFDPAWSPRGDRIAFVSTESGNDEIYVMNADGTNVQRLTFNSWEWDKHPTWSSNGNQIVFYSNRETGRRQLWVMNADGSGQRRLLDSPYNDWDPVWVK